MSSPSGTPKSMEAMESGTSRPNPTSYPMRALFRKSATLQRRQKKTNCCQICCPVTGVLMIFLLQLVVNATTSGIGDKVVVSTAPISPISAGAFSGRAFPFTNAPLFNLIQSYMPTTNNASLLPSFTEYPSDGAIDAYLFAEMQAAQKAPNLFGRAKADDSSTARIPIAAVSLPQQADLANRLSYSLFVNNNTRLRLCQNSQPYMTGISKPSDLNGFGAPMLADPCAVIVGGGSANLMNSAFLRSRGFASNITTQFQAMPVQFTQQTIAVAELLGVFFFPMMAFLMCPVFLFMIVLEKEQKLREASKMAGLKMTHYWICTFVFDYGMYLISMIFFFVMCGIFQFRFVRQTSPLLYLSLYFLWGINNVVFAFFLSAFLSKANSATIFGYALVLLSSIAAPILELYVFADTPDRPFLYMMYPFFAFCHGIMYLLTRCVEFRCLSLQDIDSTDPFVASVGWLIFDAFFYLLLGLYLDAVLPSQFGVRRHPLFCFSRFNEKKQYKKKVTEQRSPRTERTSLVASPVASSTGAVDDELPGEVEDADVRAERNRIESGELRPEDCAILIRNMRKEYKTSAGTKVAVRDLCLSMRDGECFALLGPNGAGKTTTISILTGLFAPSAGEVFVGGFDIATQRHKVHLSLGVCPQFDILYEELTPFEHLLYYARLKGVPAKEEKEHAESLLRKVGLAGDIGQRPSGSLSGGMKRRLSIAIALVGDPKVVLLDEFTTGLDPVSRRALWDIVADARHGRCILLTTHAMDEAETLSTRIGIMSLGRLKALGSHLQLKNKFGQGYRVSVSFLEQDAERVKSFMKRVLPTASIASDFAGTCLYEVPRADVRMSEVFRMMEENKVQAGIRDYGLSLTSMEDVFLQIVRDEEITPAVGK